MPFGKTFSLLSGAAVAFVVIAIVACTGGDEPALEQEVIELSIELGSNAFTEGSSIPTKYTCDGEDVSPP